jgi:hypothetical protein
MMTPNQALISAYQQEMEEMDAVLHCGDITGEQVYAYLNSHPRFFAVAGNMDSGQWADTLPRKTSVQLGQFRIGMVHGFGLGSGSLVEQVVSSFKDQELDLICFGHTHRRLYEPDAYPVPVLNPGSFSLPKGSPAGLARIELRPGWKPDVKWIDVA